MKDYGKLINGFDVFWVRFVGEPGYNCKRGYFTEGRLYPVIPGVGEEDWSIMDDKGIRIKVVCDGDCSFLMNNFEVVDL